MTDIPALNVRVVVDASGVTAGVAKATDGLEQISARSKKLTSSLSSLKTTMLGVFGGTLLTNAVMGVGRELANIKNETIALQSSTIRLNQALAGVGITSEATQKAVFNNADAYYQLGFQGSETITAMGTLVTATGDVTQANKLMAMSADLARYKHIDMESAAKILARGTQGSAKAFKELGITLDTTIPKNQAISKAFDELNKKIGGQAQAYTKSFAGQMDILKERFDNIAQAIGAVVIPILTKLVSFLSGAFSWISQNSTALKVFAGLLTTVAIAVKGWAIAQAALNAILAINPLTLWVAGIAALAVGFVTLYNNSKIFRETMVETLATITQMIGYIVGGFASLARILSKVPGMGFLKGVADDADSAAISIGKVAKSVDDLKNKKITAPKIPSISGIVKPGDPTGIKGNIVGGDAATGGGGGGGGTVQYVTVYASNTNDIAKKLSKAAKNGTPIGGK